MGGSSIMHVLVFFWISIPSFCGIEIFAFVIFLMKLTALQITLSGWVLAYSVFSLVLRFPENCCSLLVHGCFNFVVFIVSFPFTIKDNSRFRPLKSQLLKMLV